MKQWLKNRIKKLGENIEASITQIIFLALIGGSVTILVVSKKVLGFVHKILIKPTPLWITLMLGLLCCLYIHLKLRKNSLKSPKKYNKISFVEIDHSPLKWKIFIDYNGFFTVSDTPYCSQHDTKLIENNKGYVCPYNYEDGCVSSLNYEHYSIELAHVKSKAEKQIRNSKEFKNNYINLS